MNTPARKREHWETLTERARRAGAAARIEAERRGEKPSAGTLFDEFFRELPVITQADYETGKVAFLAGFAARPKKLELKEPNESDWRDVGRPRKDDHPAFGAMRDACRRLELPIRFGTDVALHDRRCVAELEPSTRFAWILYPHGSHLVYDGANLRSAHETLGGNVFAWDGRQLHETDLDGAVAMLTAHVD